MDARTKSTSSKKSLARNANQPITSSWSKLISKSNFEYLTAKDLQIGNYVLLVYDKTIPRKVEAILDTSVFLEGRDGPDDERDLIPIHYSSAAIRILDIKREKHHSQASLLISLPYVHLVQQLDNLIDQSRQRKRMKVKKACK